jgi:hypothetical protein
MEVVEEMVVGVPIVTTTVQEVIAKAVPYPVVEIIKGSWVKVVKEDFVP